MPQLPFVCLSCHTVFKRVEVSRPVTVGEYSSAYCPACLRSMEAKWYGSKATEEAVEARR